MPSRYTLDEKRLDFSDQCVFRRRLPQIRPEGRGRLFQLLSLRSYHLGPIHAHA
jgi:hypothetical protein